MLSRSKPLVSSHVVFNMISIRKKKQQKKKLFSQLDESEADLMVGQGNHEAQVENRANMADKGISSKSINRPIQVISPQMDMHTLEEKFLVKYEVNWIVS